MNRREPGTGNREPGAAGWTLMVAGFLCLLAMMFLPASATAQQQDYVADREGAPVSEEARKAISRVRSPYCPGLMLEVCPSQPAEALRDSMRVLGAQGHGAREIEEWMLANHGEEWRAVPRRSGLSLWAWVLPPMVLVGGLGVLGLGLRRMRVRRTHAPPDEGDADLSADDDARLVAALEEWERSGDTS